MFQQLKAKTMKTIYSLVLFLAAIVLLGSCAGNFQVEKRHYRSGWYVSAGRKQNEPKPLKEQDVSAKPSEPIATKKVFTARKKDSILQAAVPAICLKEEKEPVVQQTVSERVTKTMMPAAKSAEKSTRPGDDDKAARNKTILVSVFASLSAICILLGFVLLSTGMLPLFMIFGALFALAALGIYFEKKSREPRPVHEHSSGNPPGIDRGERIFLILFASFLALVILGFIGVMLIVFSVLGGL